VPALTQVREEFVEGRHNYRLLFGRAKFSRTARSRPGYTARLNYFTEGCRFALDLWSRNTYGTVRWRCFVCETVSPGDEAERVPFVTPAARVLLSTQGVAQSRLFLAWVALITEQGVDPLVCPADLFLAAHFRLHGSRADRTQPQRLSGCL
jgi:Protein of unknown function (DUF2840)